MFFKSEAVGLFEDLPEIEGKLMWVAREKRIKELYAGNAWNCWYASIGYLVMFAGASTRLIICLYR